MKCGTLPMTMDLTLGLSLPINTAMRIREIVAVFAEQVGKNL